MPCTVTFVTLKKYFNYYSDIKKREVTVSKQSPPFGVQIQLDLLIFALTILFIVVNKKININAPG